MTEKEAKTKWCPMLGAKQREHGSTIFPDSINCITSDCMMWQTSSSMKPVYGNKDEIVGFELTPSREGYCGLVR